MPSTRLNSPQPTRIHPHRARAVNTSRRSVVTREYRVANPIRIVSHVNVWKTPSHSVLIFRPCTVSTGYASMPTLSESVLLSMWCHCSSWWNRIPSTKPPRPTPSRIPGSRMRPRCADVSPAISSASVATRGPLPDGHHPHTAIASTLSKRSSQSLTGDAADGRTHDRGERAEAVQRVVRHGARPAGPAHHGDRWVDVVVGRGLLPD